MNAQHHELYHNYQPEEQSELSEAMCKELELRGQYAAAQQVLRARTQELRILMGQFKQFNSRTSVEEVMETQRQAEALRWLITCIERELRELEELCRQQAAEVNWLAQRPNGGMLYQSRGVESYPRTAVLLPA